LLVSQFIESVCFEKGEYRLLDLHQQRVDKTFKKYYPLTIPFNLEAHLPKLDFEDKYKVRVVYNNESVDIEFAEYHRLKVQSMKVVETTGLSYAFKHKERGKIEKLYELRGAADDIIIINDGKVTDSSYGNLVFWDGNKWYTPKTYLLNGVKRQFHLKYGLILEKSISAMNIKDFEKVCLINAMLDLGDVEINFENIEV
jgi:4-amino-4-deoxychorismate lyase